MVTRKDWDQLVREISSHPYLDLVEVRFEAPVSAESILTFEDEFDFKLPDAIKRFYRAFNGVRIEWALNEDRLTDEVREKIFEHDYFTDIDGSTGLINIQPFEGCFLESGFLEPMFDESDMDDNVEFKNMTWTNREIIRFMKPFDIFETFHEDQCMSFFVDPVHYDVDVLLLTDHYAGWNYSRLTDFDSYLIFLKTTRGLVRARSLVFEEDGGDVMEKWLFGEEDVSRFTPKLFCGDFRSS